ncbi:MAG TPA: SDR family NAD(P)-dependent oxidoreductase [Dehalococcoidia bacterium]|nr:SDR family NAD(P)-dependent oxidoreductase [Dehalococcoidia bacterium]
MKDFNGKVVYIVGGSSGIGLATAKALAAEGAHIVIFARRKEHLEQALGQIKSARVSSSQRLSYMQVDVSVWDEVKAVMSRAVTEFGVPDVLINCAGRAYPRVFEEISYQQFTETMEVNFYGIWHTTAVLVPYMKENGGHIVNVSSIAGFLGLFGYTDYSASKFAIIGFSEALRSELKQYGITVSVLCPPDTDTPGFHEENKTKPEETRAISAGAKLRQPDEIARALIDGMKKGEMYIIPGFDGRLIFLLKRLFPGLVEFVMDSTIKRVQAQRRNGGSPQKETAGG